MRSDGFYHPGLDILRALAFLLVFIAHGFIFEIDKPTQIGAIARAGEFAVCVFFFLSAYLITELLLREKAKAGVVSIRAFYARRVLRIWPLYFAMIGFRVFSGVLDHKYAVSAGWDLALALMYANWYTIGHGYPPGFLLPLWSIAVEEQFYLAWPWLMKWLSPAMLAGVAFGVILAAYATLAMLLHWRQRLDPGLWANSFVQFQFFGLGTLTALALRGRRLKLPIAARWGFLVGGLLCLRGAQAAVFSDDARGVHDFLHVAPRFGLVLAACLGFFWLCCRRAGWAVGRKRRRTWGRFLMDCTCTTWFGCRSPGT